MEKWAPGVENIYQLDDNGKQVLDDKGKPIVVGTKLLGDFNHLHEILLDTLNHQRDELHYDIDVDEVMSVIFDPANTPDFLLGEVERGSFDPELADKYGYTDYVAQTSRTKFNLPMQARLGAGEFDDLVYCYPEYAVKFADYEQARKVKLKVPIVEH
jgi:hypothetical protein